MWSGHQPADVFPLCRFCSALLALSHGSPTELSGPGVRCDAPVSPCEQFADVLDLRSKTWQRREVHFRGEHTRMFVLNTAFASPGPDEVWAAFGATSITLGREYTPNYRGLDKVNRSHWLARMDTREALVDDVCAVPEALRPAATMAWHHSMLHCLPGGDLLLMSGPLCNNVCRFDRR